MSNRTLYGGQAVIEGVMIRGRSQAALSIRKADGRIVRRVLSLERWANSRLRQIPFIRGVLVLLETLLVGMRSLTISANEAAEDEALANGKAKKSEDEKAISNLGMAGMLTLSLALGTVIFFLVPLFISRGVEALGAGHVGANIAEGLVRLVIFVGYIWLIGKMSDIRRVFGYHGAEHMTVAAHEAGLPLTIENIRKFPAAHPRCGTSFLMTVIVVSILLFIVIPREPLWLLIASRIVLIPPIAAIAYELIRFAGTHPNMLGVRVLGAANLLLQELTTRKPDDEMIEVAIDAMEYALALDRETETVAVEPVPVTATASAFEGRGPSA